MLVADTAYYSLSHIRNRQHIKAGSGGAGGGSQKHGKRGEDVLLRVPLGTVAYREDGDGPAGEVVAEGDRLLLARGGRGGRGNKHFSTAVHKTPRFAEKGAPGEEVWYRLELRLLADVGLVGLPNAGKSTLLGASTMARPKVGDYAFTTLEPQLGIVDIDYERFVLVDIPGLVEGASEGVGLGDQFLRHVRRTRVLIHLVSGEVEDPGATVAMVNRELTAFDPDLAERPQILAVNKMDLPAVAERRAAIRAALAQFGSPVHCISAATGEGVTQLMKAALAAVRAAAIPELPASQATYRVFRPLEEARERVVRQGEGVFVLEGPAVPELVVAREVGRGELALIVRERLRRTGWRRVIERAGVKAGDRVVAGEVQVEW